MTRASRCLVAMLGASFALPVSSCQAVDPTEMIVLVDTNLPIASQSGSPALAGQIRTISFQVDCIAEAGDPPCRLRDRDVATFTGLEQSYEQAGLGTRPPFYFVLRRDVVGVRRTFRVTATAHVGPAATEEIVTATVSAPTVESESQVMVLVLRDECIGATCTGTMTCTLGGGCAPIAQTTQTWPGNCASVTRPGLTMRECTDNLFMP